MTVEQELSMLRVQFAIGFAVLAAQLTVMNAKLIGR
jgi:hypothetical protein